MAYFPNGSAGDVLQRQCDSCPIGAEPCPIALAQSLYNFNAVGNEVATAVLDGLVAPDGACQMVQIIRRLADRLAVIILALLLAPMAASGQGLKIDQLTPAIPSESGRKAAAAVSWATLGAGMGIDLAADMAGCRGRHDCAGTAGWAAARAGATTGAVLALKFAVRRTRPCAPDCGGERTDTSLPSGHTAYAFSATGGPRAEFTIPLAITTAGLRVAGGKHWLTDVLAGAGIGWATSHIRGRRR